MHLLETIFADAKVCMALGAGEALRKASGDASPSLLKKLRDLGCAAIGQKFEV